MQFLAKIFAIFLSVCGVLGQFQALNNRGNRICRGASAKPGDLISVHYEGFIDKSSSTGKADKLFDASHRRGEPFKFKLGVGQVIKGWDEQIVGMCLGEKGTLIIPPEKAYGDAGAGKDIPPHATLRFEIDIVGINHENLDIKSPPNIFQQMDLNRDMFITREEMMRWFNHEHPDKIQQIPPGQFEREDKNNDGVISWSEFEGPKGHDDHDSL